MVVVDEADSMIDGTQTKFLWPVLRYFRPELPFNMAFKTNIRRTQAKNATQLVFAGATLPSNGRQSQLPLLNKHFPHAVLCQSHGLLSPFAVFIPPRFSLFPPFCLS